MSDFMKNLPSMELLVEDFENQGNHLKGQVDIIKREIEAILLKIDDSASKVNTAKSLFGSLLKRFWDVKYTISKVKQENVSNYENLLKFLPQRNIIDELESKFVNFQHPLEENELRLKELEDFQKQTDENITAFKPKLDNFKIQAERIKKISSDFKGQPEQVMNTSYNLTNISFIIMDVEGQAKKIYEQNKELISKVKSITTKIKSLFDVLHNIEQDLQKLEQELNSLPDYFSK